MPTGSTIQQNIPLSAHQSHSFIGTLTYWYIDILAH